MADPNNIVPNLK